MSVIRWEDPPPVRPRRFSEPLDYRAAAALIKARPNRWAVIAETFIPGAAGTTVTRVRRGLLGFEPDGAYEAQMRTDVNGRHTVYARYIGEGPDSTSPEPGSTKDGSDG